MEYIFYPFLGDTDLNNGEDEDLSTFLLIFVPTIFVWVLIVSTLAVYKLVCNNRYSINYNNKLVCNNRYSINYNRYVNFVICQPASLSINCHLFPIIFVWVLVVSILAVYKLVCNNRYSIEQHHAKTSLRSESYNMPMFLLVGHQFLENNAPSQIKKK